MLVIGIILVDLEVLSAYNASIITAPVLFSELVVCIFSGGILFSQQPDVLKAILEKIEQDKVKSHIQKSRVMKEYTRSRYTASLKKIRLNQRDFSNLMGELKPPEESKNDWSGNSKKYLADNPQQAQSFAVQNDVSKEYIDDNIHEDSIHTLIKDSKINISHVDNLNASELMQDLQNKRRQTKQSHELSDLRVLHKVDI